MNPNTNPIIIGKKIRRAMEDMNISVKELAEKSAMPAQTLYSILNGHHNPSPKKIQMLCKILRISLDVLYDIEPNAYPIYPEPYRESLSYAVFEEIWFGVSGGWRISVSRNFSTANQSTEMREEFFRKVFKYSDKQLEVALEAFKKRKTIIEKNENGRTEIVVLSEIKDFIRQNSFFKLISPQYVRETIENIIGNLENNPHRFEVFVIPRQNFLVNYEIINREVILFDLGSIFLRQTHDSILDHFLREVENFKSKISIYKNNTQVIKFLKDELYDAGK